MFIRIIFIILIISILFTVGISFNNNLNERQRNALRKLYFLFWIAETVVVTSFIGFSRPTSITITAAIFILIAIVLYILVVNNRDIQDFTLHKSKISISEIKNNLEAQNMNVEALMEKIEAEYKSIQYMETYLEEREIATKLEQNHDEFFWKEEFKALLRYYYCFQNSNITVEVLNASDLDVDVNFKLSDLDLQEIYSNIVKEKSTLIVEDMNCTLVIPYLPVFYKNKLVIILKGNNKSLFEIEQRLILNIIKTFENSITNIIDNMLCE